MSRRLEDVHLFIVERNGAEHVAAYVNPRLKRLEPMIAATPEKLDELMEIAQQLVSMNPAEPMRVIRLHEREDIAEIVPAPVEGET